LISDTEGRPLAIKLEPGLSPVPEPADVCLLPGDSGHPLAVKQEPDTTPVMETADDFLKSELAGLQEAKWEPHSPME